MSRIRTVKPSFFKHAEIFEAELETGFPLRLAFAGLWTVADREGRFKWKPRDIKTDVLPHDAVDFSRVLDALVTRGFIERYEVDGEPYAWIPTFKDHQVINNRESQSVLPAPPTTRKKKLNKNNGNSDASVTRTLYIDDAPTTRTPRDTHAPVGEGKGSLTTLPPISPGDSGLGYAEATPARPTLTRAERSAREAADERERLEADGSKYRVDPAGYVVLVEPTGAVNTIHEPEDGFEMDYENGAALKFPEAPEGCALGQRFGASTAPHAKPSAPSPALPYEPDVGPRPTFLDRKPADQQREAV